MKKFKTTKKKQPCHAMAVAPPDAAEIRWRQGEMAEGKKRNHLPVLIPGCNGQATTGDESTRDFPINHSVLGRQIEDHQKKKPKGRQTGTGAQTGLGLGRGCQDEYLII